MEEREIRSKSLMHSKTISYTIRELFHREIRERMKDSWEFFIVSKMKLAFKKFLLTSLESGQKICPTRCPDMNFALINSIGARDDSASDRCTKPHLRLPWPGKDIFHGVWKASFSLTECRMFVTVWRGTSYDPRDRYYVIYGGLTRLDNFEENINLSEIEIPVIRKEVE